ncbi:MAG: EAL domain-containing protein [Acidimicrobiia bacterium]
MRGALAGIACAAIGVVLTWMLAGDIAGRDAAATEERFIDATRKATSDLRAGAQRYADVLTMASRTWEIAGPLDRDDFVAWGDGLGDEYEGFGAVIFVTAVRAVDVDQLVAEQRRSGAEDFAVRSQSFAADLMVVTASTSGSTEFDGVDLGGAQERRAAFEQARDTGRPVVTAPFTLVADDALPRDLRPQAFAMYAPVYREGAPTSTVAERRAALLGWMATALHGKQFVDALAVGGQSMAYEIFDASAGDAVPPLGRWGAGHPDGFRVDVSTDVFGRTWLVRYRSTDARSETTAHRWILVFGVALSLAAGLGIARQSRLRRRQREAVARATSAARQANRRFVALVEHSADIICVVSADGTMRYVSPAGERMLGHRQDAGRPHRFGSLIHDDDREQIVSAFAALVDQPGCTTTAEARIVDDRGGWHHVEFVATNLLDDEDVRGVVVNVRDVTARAEASRELTWHASHDALTGLANRALLMSRLDECVHASLHRGRNVALLYLDLDKFKEVNDSLGHGAGDRLLCEVAARLERSVRSSDTVARVGGDEFVVLLDGASRTLAVEIAGRISTAFASPVDLGSGTVVPAASIGIAVGLGQSAEQLLREADAALYRAKASGGGWKVFDRHVREEIEQRRSIEELIRQTIDRDAIITRYQPIIDLSTGTIMAIETFARLRDATGALLAPSQFLAIAEDSGLITELGAHILDHACRTAQLCRDRHGLHAMHRLSVNVSARQLQDPAFADMVTATLERYDLPGSLLALEIDERTIIDADERAVSAVEELHRNDVTIVVDDFGSGSSSISSLRRLPVDWLKLDRSIVAGLGTNSRDSEIARSVIGIGRSLGLLTVAEGIEDPSQLTMLRELGCDYGQGYLISPPLTRESVLAQLGEQAIDRAG